MSQTAPVTSRTEISAPPDRVFAIVANADEFARMSGGMPDGIHDGWPASGSRLVIRPNRGLLRPPAVSTVRGCEPPHRLDLRVEVPGVLVSDVELVFDDHDGETGVSLVDRPVSGVVARAPAAVLHRWLRRRDARLLERLRASAVRTARPTEGQQVTATDRGEDVRDPHPEIAEAERSGRGDPYAGLRDGVFESDARYDPDHPTRPRRPQP